MSWYRKRRRRSTRSLLHSVFSVALRGGIVCTTLLALTGPSLEAQTPPLPANSGVTSLPQDAPPTGPHKQLPAPAGVAAKPDQPLTTSPTLARLMAGLTDRPITLDDAIAIALTVNRNLAFAGQALYRAQGVTEVAQSGLAPTVGYNPADVYQNSALQPGYTVTATLPIDITGILRAATDQARFQEVGARLDINRTRNQIVFNVETAYYNALRAQTLVKVAVENLQNSLDRLHDAQLRYSAQTVAYLDVVRAQTDVADGQKQVIQARNAVSVDIAQLNNVIGIEVTTPLRISDQNAVEQPPGVPPPSGPILTPNTPPPAVGAPPAPLETAPPPASISATPDNLSAQKADAVIAAALKLGPEFQAVLKEALQTRPEILEAEANIAALKKGILIARSSQLPSLSVGAGYYYIRSATGVQLDEPEAIINLNIPLYDGGLARGRVRQARADVATATTNKRQQVDLVEQAYLNLVQARDQVAVANQALSQAQTGFQIARVRYNAGVASRAGLSPLLEVSDAQAALTLAEQNQVNSLYDYNNARAQLDRSIGRFAYVQNGPGYPSIPPAKVVGSK